MELRSIIVSCADDVDSKTVPIVSKLTSSHFLIAAFNVYMGEFPSGQRGQTVNLLALPSVVRIHLPPFLF